MSESGTSPPLERFLRRHGILDYDRLVERADKEPEWFWPAVMDFHGLRFFKPYERLLDVSKGPEWAEWCVGGTTNLAYNCLDRTIANGHAQDRQPFSGKARMAAGARSPMRNWPRRCRGRRAA